MKTQSAVAAILFTSLPLVSAITASAAEPPAGVQSRPMEEIIIVGIREDRKSRGATGLDLNIYETPQSLTIVNSSTLTDFGLVDINSALRMTTGVNVDATETDRTYYNSRGFDITSMHIDGVGAPFGELIVGDLDTAIYEKIAVIRGSNGLITGVGNPSGTINYERKRPNNEFSTNVEITKGKWNNQRQVLDVNVPLTKSGSWAARFVGVSLDKDSWLNLNSNDRNVLYGVADGQIGDRTTLTLAYTQQDNNSNGVLWGAVPMIYSDGTALSFDRSTSTTMDWTFWDTLTKTSFAEVGYRLSDSWHLTTSLTYTDYEEASELFYVYWLSGIDKATGLGLNSYPGKYNSGNRALVWDTNLEGKFVAWDQDHKFNVGLSLADQDSDSLDFAAVGGFQAMPSFPGWSGNEVPRPDFAAPTLAAQEQLALDRLYGSLLLSATENLKIVLGVSFVNYKNDGVSFGVPTTATEDGTSPYLGFTWEISRDLNLYGSYSDIYQPQYYLDESLQPLGSAEGESYEVGLKRQFNGNFLLTLAVFRTTQENLQEFVEYGDGDGIDDLDFSDDFNYALYRGISVESDGVELELSGQLGTNLELQAGFTYLNMRNPAGGEARTFIPRKTMKLLATWNPDWNRKLALGLSARWQDDIYFDSAYGQINQDSYAVVGGFVSYDINDAVRLTLHADNIADEAYLSSVKYEQSYFAAPRSYSLTLNWHL